MSEIVLDVEAGQVSAELAKRGIAPHARVHVRVDVTDADTLPMASLAQAGKGLDWLNDEPDLYSDADLVERVRNAAKCCADGIGLYATGRSTPSAAGERHLFNSVATNAANARALAVGM